ncbi:MAG: TRAP transporter large permease subunit [Xanthobacteraceae bacterium]|nr:TRAP transporter large permease subunit [Xanthobacteraceae bacterium]MBX3522356.1 TRAP transporter large permease subunit [Xanthobacteraceae bacterium]MBX3535294.1 TRAP transporter large permease subunit [Xanthobacteraceae bacterium]MBX3548401.1 TRAP transporter large permease subunit [Xanthobacteraceae bacterium]MCW5674087.1 TRAP transporter large permease subunit [Xanthobacteraceae bacterium]
MSAFLANWGIGNPELGVIMLVLFVLFIMLGFPIAFTLMALGVFFGYFAMGDLVFSLVVQRTYSVMTNDVLISIPLFVFMGYVIERANVLDRLFRSLQLAAGPVPASLALATLATCAIFATATGIVGAVVTLMGLLAFPAMLRAGYDVKISAAVVCAGGCLGILIPPSVMLILYGATAGVSVVKLYAGAFFPGIMLASLYMLLTILMAVLNPKLAPKLTAKASDIDREVSPGTVKFFRSPLPSILYAAFIAAVIWFHDLGATWIGVFVIFGIGNAVYAWRLPGVYFTLLSSFLPLGALIAAALGTIVFGIATPTEAAAMGSLGALILALLYGADYSARWKSLLVMAYGIAMGALLLGLFLFIPFRTYAITVLVITLAVALPLIPYNNFGIVSLRESIFLTARTTAMVCWLFIGSFIFSAIFAYLGGHGPIEKFVLWMNLNQTGFMVLAQAIIFVLGWPLEWTEIIVIFMPIFLPLLKTFEIDPLFFGLLVALNIQTSFLSPPVAMAPFYLKGVAPSWVNINDIFRGVLPYMLVVIVSMVMLYAFPQIGLALPNYLYPGGKTAVEGFAAGLNPAVLFGAGVIAFAITAGTLWASLPRGGRMHRFVNTELEPYVALLLTAGVALSFTLLLSGAINLWL